MKISIFDHLLLKIEETGMAPLPLGGVMTFDPKTATGKLTAQAVADRLAARMEKIPLLGDMDALPAGVEEGYRVLA